MKKIEAVIRPVRLQDVKTVLSDLGVSGMTIVEVRGFGRQRGQTQVYRGTKLTADFVSKVALTVVVRDDQVETIKDAIAKAAHTGEIGDGKIFVTPVERVIRIRTGDQGDDAL